MCGLFSALVCSFLLPLSANRHSLLQHHVEGSAVPAWARLTSQLRFPTLAAGLARASAHPHSDIMSAHYSSMPSRVWFSSLGWLGEMHQPFRGGYLGGLWLPRKQPSRKHARSCTLRTTALGWCVQCGPVNHEQVHVDNRGCLGNNFTGECEHGVNNHYPYRTSHDSTLWTLRWLLADNRHVALGLPPSYKLSTYHSAAKVPYRCPFWRNFPKNFKKEETVTKSLVLWSAPKWFKKKSYFKEIKPLLCQ